MSNDEVRNSRIANREFSKKAKQLGIKYDGEQLCRGKEPLQQFTDPKTGTTFYLNEGETLEQALIRKRKQFGATND